MDTTKYSKDDITKSYYINRFGKLSTSFMFYQMQEMAWEHANKLGFGYEHLKENALFWVLSRLLVKIKRRPEWKEKFTIATWSRGTDGFYGYRDYHFLDADKNPIIEATSNWLAIDLQTKRIQRLSDFKHFAEYSESIFNANAQKVKPPKNDKPINFTPVLFNEIDINQHFNTGRYIERIIDSYSFDFHKKNELIEFELNFSKEGMPHDLLGVKRQELDSNNHLCSVVRQSDNVDLIKARLVWGDR